SKLGMALQLLREHEECRLQLALIERIQHGGTCVLVGPVVEGEYGVRLAIQPLHARMAPPAPRPAGMPLVEPLPGRLRDQSPELVPLPEDRHVPDFSGSRSINYATGRSGGNLRPPLPAPAHPGTSSCS